MTRFLIGFVALAFFSTPALAERGDSAWYGEVRGGSVFAMDSEEDLLGSVRRVTAEAKPSKRSKSTETVSFINSKGGSGATFLATNTAHMLTAVADQQTVLVDLDLQFGNLTQYLDLKPTRGIFDALDVADDLDSVAIEAYLTKHESGLSVLAGMSGEFDAQSDMMLDGFERVMELLSSNYEKIIVDLPRHIDAFSASVLERSDRVAIVVQQSIPSLQDGARVYDILTKRLAIPADRIMIVLNRMFKNAAVELSDVAQSLNGSKPFVIPNDYQAVSESVNIGVPIYDLAKRSPVTKALLQLIEELDGRPAAKPKGLISRLRGAARQG